MNPSYRTRCAENDGAIRFQLRLFVLELFDEEGRKKKNLIRVLSLGKA